jgi:hypothetical protein
VAEVTQSVRYAITTTLEEPIRISASIIMRPQKRERTGARIKSEKIYREKEKEQTREEKREKKRRREYERRRYSHI